jgi:hypothetical protein
MRGQPKTCWCDAPNAAASVDTASYTGVKLRPPILTRKSSWRKSLHREGRSAVDRLPLQAQKSEKMTPPGCAPLYKLFSCQVSIGRGQVVGAAKRSKQGVSLGLGRAPVPHTSTGLQPTPRRHPGLAPGHPTQRWTRSHWRLRLQSESQPPVPQRRSGLWATGGGGNSGQGTGHCKNCQKVVTPPTHRGCSGEGEAHHTSHSWQGCLHCEPTVWTGRDGHER